MHSRAALAASLFTAITTVSASCVGIGAASPSCRTNETLYHRDFFYFGGHYEYSNSSAGNLLVDQLYVEKLTPAVNVTQPYPLVLFHGGGPSGVTWLNTPDNRKGWASYFLEQGYLVYIIDQTSVGRATDQGFDRYPLRIGSTAEIAEVGFTIPESVDAYPQSLLHTQWPGNGSIGDPIFDAFMGSFVPLTSNLTTQELSMRKSGCAMLRTIGPSLLISHSIGALHPFLLSNDCPELVVANVNIEPGNTPFESYTGNATSSVGRSTNRAWGMTNTYVTYSPPVNSSTDLSTVTVGTDTPANRSCILQAEPARKLPQIAKVPYVAFTGEASPHITYDHCVIAFLQQAGVPNVDWVKLGDIGIHGNAHFSFLEKNNLVIAAVVDEWMKNTASNSTLRTIPGLFKR